MNSTRRRFLQFGAAGVGLALPGSSAAPDNDAENQSATNAKSAGGGSSRSVLATVNDEISSAAGNAPLTMLFQGRTPEELAAWQKQFSKKLLELIGPNAPPPRWSVKTLGSANFPDFTREELVLTDGMRSLPLYAMRPKSRATEKFPIVLCLHGHGRGGHDSVAGRDDFPELVEEIQKRIRGSRDVMNNGPDWNERGRPRLQRAYAASGRPDALMFEVCEGGEAWYGSSAVKLLAQELQ